MKRKNDSSLCWRTKPIVNGVSDLSEIVADYKKKYLDALEENLPKISSGTIKNCICGAINDKEYLPDDADEKYKKGPHQRRLTNAQINDFEKALKEAGIDNQKFHSFHELYSWVLKNRTNGFRELRCYDFSLCYGYNKELRPFEFVYIHAGTRAGAEALKEKGLLQSEITDRIPVKAFPQILQNLGAIHIENLLCIYNDALKGIKDVKKVKSKICIK